MEVKVTRTCAFSLTRERDQKKIDETFTIRTSEIESETFEDLMRLVTSNLEVLLSRPEKSYHGGFSIDESKVHLSVDKRTQKSPAYVVGFQKKSRKIKVVEQAMTASDDSSFFNAAKQIALWFRDSLRWPRAILFISQIVLRTENEKIPLFSVLCTQLEGRLVEHPKKIIELMRKGTIGRSVKKGLVFPHILNLDDVKTGSERKAKVWEETSRLAQYFYDFLDMKLPSDASTIISAKYNEKKKQGYSNLEDTIREVESEYVGISQSMVLKGEIDEISFHGPLTNMKEKVKVVELDDGSYELRIKGRKVGIYVGDHNIVRGNTILW